MDTLDGNAIGGLLYEAFGEEMTGFMAACAACGGVAAIAESVVYPCLPGAVVRCRSCGALLMVITHIHGVSCVDLQGVAALNVLPLPNAGQQAGWRPVKVSATGEVPGFGE